MTARDHFRAVMAERRRWPAGSLDRAALTRAAHEAAMKANAADLEAQRAADSAKAEAEAAAKAAKAASKDQVKGLRKPAKAEPRPDYLDAVRRLPCCICEAFGMVQTSPTTAHHPICGRHGTRKRPDIAAIPLCDGCHQGDFDTSKIAIHRDREEWVRRYGADTDWIAPTQDKLAHLLGAYKVDE